MTPIFMIEPVDPNTEDENFIPVSKLVEVDLAYTVPSGYREGMSKPPNETWVHSAVRKTALFQEKVRTSAAFLCQVCASNNVGLWDAVWKSSDIQQRFEPHYDAAIRLATRMFYRSTNIRPTLTWVEWWALAEASILTGDLSDDE